MIFKTSWSRNANFLVLSNRVENALEKNCCSFHSFKLAKITPALKYCSLNSGTLRRVAAYERLSSTSWITAPKIAELYRDHVLNFVPKTVFMLVPPCRHTGAERLLQRLWRLRLGWTQLSLSFVLCSVLIWTCCVAVRSLLCCELPENLFAISMLPRVGAEFRSRCRHTVIRVSSH